MALKLNSSGGGSVTLDTPSTANNYTLTAPASSGTIATTDGGNTTFTSITDSGNLTFTGTGNRITGDFSNATIANRVAFQTSTTNGATGIPIVPNGTGTVGQFILSNSSDITNASVFNVLCNSTDARLASSITGTGTYLPMTFYTGGSERMRIDTSGNVGIGTSSPETAPKLTIQATNATNGYGGIILLDDSVRANQANYVAYGRRVDGNGSSAFAGGVLLARVNTSPAALTTDMTTGRVAFGGSYDGTNANVVYGAEIKGITTGTYSSTSAPTAIAFYTTPSGTAGQSGTNSITQVGTERMRIDSSGNLLVGTTNSSVAAGSGIKFISGTDSYMGIVSSASTNAASNYHLYSTGAGAYRFYVQMDGKINATSTTIAAISDQRLKENIRDLDFGLNEVLLIKPRRFDWKEGKGQDKKNVVGFIAQEFEQVLPDSVSTSLAGADGIKYKTICHEELIPTLVKAIQELKAELDATKAEVAALKGA